jgi:DNA-binding LacI/PurR family transcriptional regulator
MTLQKPPGGTGVGPAKRPLSIYDLAHHLGISYGTVSRALNNRAEVSAATRERVLAAARDLGYSPSPLARGLARDVTPALGIVIPTLDDPFFLAFARSAQETAANAGVSVMVSFAESRDAIREAVRSFAQFRVAGVLLLGGTDRHDAEVQKEVEKTPVVVALRHSSENRFPAVYVDHEAGARAMIRLLAERGCRNIAFVGLPLESQAAEQRLSGYRKGMLEAGLGTGRELLAEGRGFIDGAAATRQLLAQPGAGEIDAIFFASDPLATGGLHTLSLCNIDVPTQISVVGFGDIGSSAVTLPSLTTVHLPMREVGERSVELLLAIIENGGAAAEDIQFGLSLVERASIRPQ